MKKLSAEKDTIWMHYVQSGKLKRYLERLKLDDYKVHEILANMTGNVYMTDYQMLNSILGASALQKLNGSIRSANYAAKNNIINMKVKPVTHDRLIEVQKKMGADTVDEAVYYLTSNKYEDDVMICDALCSPSVQILGDIDSKSLGSLLYNKLQGLDKRVFGHHYYRSVAPQLAIRARRSHLILTKAKALRKAKQLGIEEDALWYLDFGDERRKVYPAFQFTANTVYSNLIISIKEEALNYPDQLWFAALAKNISIIESFEERDQYLIFGSMLSDLNVDLDAVIQEKKD
jgi:hypothetical protein